MAGRLFSQASGDRALAAVLGIAPQDVPIVAIGHFIDESGPDIMQSAGVASALGLTAFSGRSCTYQQKGTHFEDMALRQLRALLGDVYETTGMTMAEMGTRLGKVVLTGSEVLMVRGQQMTKADYYDYVSRVNELCLAAAETGDRRAFPKLRMRLFDAYPKKGSSFEDCLGETMDLCSATLDRIDPSIDTGFEIEANLMGSDAARMSALASRVGARYRVVIDLGNLDSLGFGDQGAADEARKLLPLMASWMHFKAFLGDPGCRPGDPIREDAIAKFGPVHLDAAHEAFLPDLLTELVRRRENGFLVVLEPHFLKGGQFGGFTGLRGMGAALRSAMAALVRAGIGYELTQYQQLRPDNLSLVTSC